MVLWVGQLVFIAQSAVGFFNLCWIEELWFGQFVPFCGDTVGALVRSAVGFASLSHFLRVLWVGQVVSFPYCAVGQSVYVYLHGAVGWAACLSSSGCCQLVSSSAFLM